MSGWSLFRLMPRPARVTPLLMLAFGLACFVAATWLEGKRLWAVYNVIGSGLALLVAAAVARLGVSLPRGATIICVLTALLHYLGGSLGGHFGIEGINGMYAVFPWWDRITHFFGATGVALLATHLLRAKNRAGNWSMPPAFVAFVGALVAMAVGVGVELFEFGAWAIFGTIDQGFYSNTMMDLYSDATGAAFGAALALTRTATSDGSPPAAPEAASHEGS